MFGLQPPRHTSTLPTTEIRTETLPRALRSCREKTRAIGWECTDRAGFFWDSLRLRDLSTRSPLAAEAGLSFEAVLLAGLAPDGGLYVSGTWPSSAIPSLPRRSSAGL